MVSSVLESHSPTSIDTCWRAQGQLYDEMASCQNYVLEVAQHHPEVKKTLESFIQAQDQYFAKQPQFPIRKVLECTVFAAQCHQQQSRKGANPAPYIIHPIRVARSLSEENQDVERQYILVCSGLLHDSIEDAPTAEIAEQRAAIIAHLFGQEILSVVQEVTDDRNVTSEIKRDQQLAKIKSASDQAKCVKLADRIDNLTDMRKNPPLNWDTETQRFYLRHARQLAENALEHEPTDRAKFLVTKLLLLVNDQMNQASL